MRIRAHAALGMMAALVILAVACSTPAKSGGGGSTPVNTPPTAVIGATPTSGPAPLAVDFSGAGSIDPGGSVVSFHWNFGDGGAADQAQISHTYQQPGNYTASLLVTDNSGSTASQTVAIEVVQNFSGVVLVDDGGADMASCGTPAAPCASIGYGLDRAAADARTAVWVAEGSYPAFTVVPGIDVRGGYDASFAGAGGASVINGSFNAAKNVSAAIVATDVQADTTIAGFTAVGGNESAQGRTALAAYLSGAGDGLHLDHLILTGGQSGAAATALLVDGASTVALAAPTISGGDATGAGNSAYGIRALNGATVTVDGGTIASGAGVAGVAAGAAPARAAAGCTGANGANASGSSSPGAGGPGCAGAVPTNSGAGGKGGNFSGSAVAGSAGGGGAAAGSAGCGSSFGCGTDATGGGTGAVGAAGSAGAGASGTFNAGDTFAGQAGSAGAAGTAGAGGGGGGGGKSASASGGGGGAGGGGGTGGVAGTTGGGAGGGSFGVYANNATIILTGVSVTPGSGAKGGNGQAGGAGGNGGTGGNGGNKSCCEAAGGGGGGAGGAGGGGGGAGGGAGGPSVGALHSGTGSLTVTGSLLGAASSSALGGNGGAAGGAGASGIGGTAGNCANGGCGPTVGASSATGNAGAAGSAGAAGQTFGSWDNGATTVPDDTSTLPTTTTTSTTTTTAPPSSPVHTAVNMMCYTSASGQTSYDPNNTGATVLAPTTVAAGSQFQVEITPDSMNVPTSGGGYPIAYITNANYIFVVPAGTTFVSATLSGGSNLGTGTPTVAQAADKITLTAPGQLAAGTSANFPKITVTLQTTGSAGSTIEFKYAGTAYSDPGLTFLTKVNNIPLLGTVTSSSKCFAATNPVLATTTIS